MSRVLQLWNTTDINLVALAESSCAETDAFEFEFMFIVPFNGGMVKRCGEGYDPYPVGTKHFCLIMIEGDRSIKAKKGPRSFSGC